MYCMCAGTDTHYHGNVSCATSITKQKNKNMNCFPKTPTFCSQTNRNCNPTRKLTSV